MKSRHFIVLSLALCLCLLSACGGRTAGPDPEAPAPTGEVVRTPEESPADTSADTPAPPAEQENAVSHICRIVDGAEKGELLLAKLCRCPGPSVCRLNVDSVPVTLDGEPADASVLEDGMPIEVSYSGDVLETFPAQLGEVYSITAWSRGQRENPGGTEYDLCGLYLQVLDDLWNKDPGLNDGLTVAGLDLSRAPGELTESEKAAIAWRFGETHGVEVVTGTFEELEEQGYFTASPISTPAPKDGEDFGHMWVQWDDGCLFSITPSEEHEGEIYSLPTLFFNAEKWRSPLGAYCFYDCSAMWAQTGSWNDYNIGSEMIS